MSYYGEKYDDSLQSKDTKFFETITNFVNDVTNNNIFIDSGLFDLICNDEHIE